MMESPAAKAHVKRSTFIASAFIALLFVYVLPVWSDATAMPFEQWLSELKAEAISRGISPSTIAKALQDIRPAKKIISLDRNQPEFKRSFQEYLDRMVNPQRVRKGRKLLAAYRPLLDTIKARYGVQPNYLVAIWGLESNFGANTGGYSVIQALATLAYDARRSAFFRSELFHALKILDDGHIDVPDMKGSWAGAMGQLQFMPSTFTSYAVDGDGDGHKDIWGSMPDVFASAANFLASQKWRGDMRWGRSVRLPDGFDMDLAGMKTVKTLAQWQILGVRRANGHDLPVYDAEASVILPRGTKGPAFLVYQNYRTIMKWNRSHLYALAVCTLADRLSR